MIELTDITKVYYLGDVDIPILKGIDLAINASEYVSIMGASGSGKSTLMNIIGCLDRPTKGRYFLEGRDLTTLSKDELAFIRNQKIGFIFQQFNLLPRSTAVENVMLPMVYAGASRRQRLKQAEAALLRVGLGDRMGNRPSQLSGGQQQRVAIARALVSHPKIVLADEPTAALDKQSGRDVVNIMQRLAKEQGCTILLVTHDNRILDIADRILYMEDGQLKPNPVVEPVSA